MRWWLPMLLFAVLMLGSWAIWGGGWEESFSLDGSVERLRAAGPWAWALGIGLLVADLALPIPGTIVMSALGLLYGVWLGGLLAALGSIAAGLTGYALGRLCGEGFVRRWLGDLEFEKGRLAFARRGGWMVALSRALPILPEVISCSAGLMRMPFGRFTLALACGSVPMGFLFAAIGALGRNEPAWASAFSLGVPALLWWRARHWMKHHSRQA